MLRLHQSRQRDLIRILHVDDEPDQLYLTKLFLEREDPAFSVDSASSPQEALEKLEKFSYDCIVCDYAMPTMNGIELAVKVKRRMSIPLVLYTGRGSEDVASEAFSVGIDAYENKEANASHYRILAERIKSLVAKYWAEDELKAYWQATADIFREIPAGLLIYQYLTPDCLMLLDGNPEAERLTKLKIDELRGKEFDEIWGQGEELKEAYLSLRGTGRIFKSEKLYWVDDRISGYFRIRSFWIPGDRLAVAFENITERVIYEQRLEALHRHAAELIEAKSKEEIAEVTFNVIEQVLGYNHMSIGFVEGGYLKLSLLRRIGMPLELPLDGRGITVRAVRTGESQLVQNVEEDEDYIPGPSNVHYPTLSELDVPVKVREKVLAVINVESEKPHDFTERDQKVIEVFAELVATALERLQHNERINEMSLRGFIDGMSRLTSMVAHDLRGPLQNITNAASLLKHDTSNKEKMLDVIERSVKYSAKILEDFSKFYNLGMLDKTTVDISELIEQSVKTSLIPSIIDVEISVGSKIKASIDRTKFQRVLDNLIRDAVEAMPFGGKLTIEAEEDGDTVAIKISDTGKGISKEKIERLFDPSYTKDNEGLGLPYVKYAVEAHGGAIEVDSTVGKGTSFIIKLPATNCRTV